MPNNVSRHRIAVFGLLVGVVLSCGSCVGNPFAPPAGPSSPEAFCAALPQIGTGNYFYCSSTQANLQGGLPNGWQGSCFPAAANFSGLVGYSGYSSNGGRFPVEPTQAAADKDCGATVTSFGVCLGVTRCTRQ